MLRHPQGNLKLFGLCPVRGPACTGYSEAAAKARLSSWIAAVQQARPGNRHGTPKINCVDNIPVFAGEQLQARWQDMHKRGDGQAETLDWPSDGRRCMGRSGSSISCSGRLH